MTWNEILEVQIVSLVKQFGEREAAAMVRIIKEDYISQFDKGPQDSLGSMEVLSLEGVITSILRGHPIQYAIGIALFHNMKLKVTPAVLIPRPETEELLYWAKELLNDRIDNHYLDIGTGSGCLALGIKKYLSSAQVIALDKSETALEIAKENSQSTGFQLEFRQLDILDKTSWSTLPKFNGIVSNPPYIPENELKIMGASVVKHEPEMALMVSNEDPLVFYRNIGAFAQAHLVPNGWLLFEINEFYGKETMALLTKQGFRNIELRKDMQGKDRMIGCWK